MELIIMSAGLGSRFGGLKQIQPIDENGNFIIDYSVFDAIRVGFDKIIFVIKKENFQQFNETIGKRISKHIKISYVFQENETFEFCGQVIKRTKPLGTGQAVLLCENEVSDKFAIINSDDFYGYDSFKKLKQELDKLNPNEFCIGLFSLENTISKFGNVKRGIVETKDNYLLKINECNVEKFDEKFLINKISNFNKNQIFNKNLTLCQKSMTKNIKLNKNFLSNNQIKINFLNQKRFVSSNQSVSMNIFGANKKLFEFLKRDFEHFKKDKSNLENGEFFLPSTITNAIKNKNIKVRTFSTNSKWLGLTFKEDLNFVKENISKLQSQKIYPINLWEKTIL